MIDIKEIDDVINPKHYQSQIGFQLIDVTCDLEFWRGNALKYIYRAGNKPGSDMITDLEKAKWYLEWKINAIKNMKKTT